PEDWPRIIYIDWFGNLVTGIRAASLSHDGQLGIAGYIIPRAGTFSEVPEGMAFWYENSMSLIEIAVNRGAADEELDVEVGERIEPMPVHQR
ncbi:MAG: SAM hydroxide adenosyltransferase, partial [Rhodothermales bacterium]